MVVVENWNWKRISYSRWYSESTAAPAERCKISETVEGDPAKNYIAVRKFVSMCEVTLMFTKNRLNFNSISSSRCADKFMLPKSSYAFSPLQRLLWSASEVVYHWIFRSFLDYTEFFSWNQTTLWKSGYYYDQFCRSIDQSFHITRFFWLLIM